MKFRSQFKNVSHTREHNSGVKHPDFNADVRTTVADFITAFMKGTPLESNFRHVEYDDNPSIDDKDFDSVFNNPLGDKDIISLNDELNNLSNVTTNNDDANNLFNTSE